MELLHQPDEHVCDVIERAGELNNHQRRRQRHTFWICTFVNGPQIQRAGFGCKLFDLDIGNIGEDFRRQGLLPKPFQMFHEIGRVLSRRLSRLVLQAVPRTLDTFGRSSQ